MGTFKDTFTNVIAIIMVVVGAVSAYLQSLVGDINWAQLALVVLGAIVAYFTGKDGFGKAKKPI